MDLCRLKILLFLLSRNLPTENSEDTLEEAAEIRSTGRSATSENKRVCYVCFDEEDTKHNRIH